MEYIELINANFNDFTMNKIFIKHFLNIAKYITNSLNLNKIDLSGSFLKTNDISYETVFGLFYALCIIKEVKKQGEHFIDIQDVSSDMITLGILMNIASLYEIKVMENYRNFDDSAIRFLVECFKI